MTSSRAAFRPDIEGLRGVAILLVVLFHASVSGVSGGFVGVDVFFVLSGYFITDLLVRDYADNGTINLTEFYSRRALRLLPSLLVVLFATLAIVLFLYAPIDRAAITSIGRAVALSSGNIAFASGSVDYFSSGENPFLHTWSLAVEQQFYFFWPLLLVVVAYVWKRRDPDVQKVVTDENEARPGSLNMVRQKLDPWLVAIAVAGGLSFVASLLITRVAQPWAFFGMPTRVWEFALGAMLAVVVRDGTGLPGMGATWMQAIGLGLIAFGVLAYTRATPYPGVAAVVPALGAVAMLMGGMRENDSIVTRALSVPVLRWFGGISYTWYLWHWPLVGLAGVINPHISAWGKLAWCGIALLLAWLTHRFVERPSREGKLSHYAPQWISGVSVVASAFAALVSVGATFAAERSASSPAQQQLIAARTDRIDHGCWASTPTGPTTPCAFGDTRSATTLVLFGDSHAEHWLGALDRVGRERGWKIVLMVMGGCPVAEIPSMMHGRLKREYVECTRYREETVKRIIAMRPSGAILSSYDQYVLGKNENDEWKVAPDMWRDGLRRTYSRITAAGIPVVALRGTPRTGFNVPGCLSRKIAGVPFASACEYYRERAKFPRAIEAQTQAARGLAMQLVDMNDQICPTPRCGVVRNGQVIFTDDNHLTLSFSRSLAEVFELRLSSAFLALGQLLP